MATKARNGVLHSRSSPCSRPTLVAIMHRRGMKCLPALSLTFLTILWPACAAADIDPLVVHPETHSVTMALYMEWLEDRSGTLAIEDVTAPDVSAKFQAAGPKNLNFGMTSSVIWLRFSLTNNRTHDESGATSREKDMVLNMGWPALGDVRVFVPGESPGSWKELQAGALHPPNPEDDALSQFCALRLPLPPTDSTWTYYVRIRSDASMILPVSLCTNAAFQRYSDAITLGFGLFYGLILATLIVNLTVYPWLRDKSLLWYSAVLFFLLLYFIEYNMIRPRYLPIGDANLSERLSHFLLACTFLVIVPFYRSCLQVDRRSNVFDRLSTAYLVLAVPGVLMTFLPIVSLGFLKSYDGMVGCGILIVIFASTIASWRSRYRPGRILPLGWAILGVFAIKHLLTLWGFLSATMWSNHTLQIGAAVLIVVFSYAVMYRIKVIREDSERAARESEARYRLLADNITDVIWTMNSQGRFTYISPSVQRVYGYSVEEAMQRELEDFLSPHSAQLARTALAREFQQTGQSPHAQNARPVFELEQFKKDGSGTWAESNVCVLHDAHGKPVEIMGVTRDITERKRAETEREEMQERIRHVQKLESLGVLAGGIAHDFNNLLLLILGYADMATADLPPMAPARESIGEIETAARRAAELCRQMLAYSGRGKLVVGQIYLGDLVTEMLHLLKASISKKAILNLNLEKGLPPIEGDATQIRQIVMNLITNASETIDDRSGIITVSTGAMECSRADLAGTPMDEGLKEGLYVYLEVSDTGGGMDDETIGRIFDPFFTTKFTGRGLGLSAVIGIARGHKGTLRVHSQVGKGTTFRILFPAAEVIAESPTVPDAAGEEVWKGNGCILLVDDEETIRTLGKRMLERMGFDVVTAGDGREAVQIYGERGQEIDMVLLDLTMPHMDGEETFCELCRLNPNVRVTISSGYAEHEIEARFAGKGLAGVIQKPYSMATLRDHLRAELPKHSPAAKSAD